MKLFMYSIYLLIVLLYNSETVFSLDNENSSMLCSELCYCYESTQYHLPMWTIDCTMQNFVQIRNESLPPLVAFLDYSRNQITNVTYTDHFTSVSLRKLDLSRNKIVYASDKAFQNFPNLLHLDLSYNELAVINPELFFGLMRLISLDLTYNYIKDLPNEVFITLPVLDTLALSYNPVGLFLSQNGTKLFHTLGLSLTQNIRVLKLENISMTTEPFEFVQGAEKLEELYIAENPISLVNISAMPQTIKILDLSGTEIRNIQPINQSNLEILLINRMKNLTSIEDYTFSNLSVIRTISIEDCLSLKTISKFAFGERNDWSNYTLKQFTVARSSLTFLDSYLKDIFNQLDSVDLNSNSWNCTDCQLQWMTEIVNLEHKNELRCLLPKRYEYRQITFLQNVCERISTAGSSSIKLSWITTLVIVGILLTLIVVGIVLYLKLGSVHTINAMVAPGPTSPYSRITIEPNTMDY